VLECLVCDWFLVNVFVATRWKEAGSGQHVEYDQRPDVFRFSLEIISSCIRP